MYLVKGVKPKMLDLYCCQGGASMGYMRAGFDVTGSDLDEQPRYPFSFIRGDALAILMSPVVRQFEVIAASPPCQRRTKAQKIQGREHPALIAPTRELLIATGKLYIIENVPACGEDDDPLIDPLELCGAMFGLRTYRHRHFESSVPLTAPEHPRHEAPTVKMGRPLAEGDWYHAVGNFSNVPYVKADLGVPWMTRDGVRECIPPTYTEYLGRQLLEKL